MKRLFNYKPYMDYSKISTLQELKEVRTKIDSEVLHKEYELKEKIDSVKYMLSPVRILTTLYAKFNIIENICNGAVKGYYFIKDLINKKKESYYNCQSNGNEEASAGPANNNTGN